MRPADAGDRAASAPHAADAALLDALARGATIVTATRRLARAVLHDWDGAQVAAGRTAWTTADVLPWRAWIERTWRSAGGDRVLPTATQLRAVWEQTIADDPGVRAQSLLRLDAAADLALEAHGLAHAFALPLRDHAHATPEVEAFVRWRASVEARMARDRWADPAALPAALTALVGAQQMALPGELVLAGFDELVPADATLVAALRAVGTVRTWRRATGAPARWTRVVGADLEDECALLAAWIRATWRPGARLGVVALDLGASRAVVTRVLERELVPAAVLPGSETALPFDVSLGIPLAEEPVVEAALLGLRALAMPLRWDEADRLLGAPHVGAPGEAFARARHQLDLRRRGNATIGLARLVRDARAAGAAGTAAGLERAARTLGDGPATFGPAAWAARIDAALADLGWPGPRAPSSREAQALAAWQDTLRSFAALDGIARAMDLATALAELRRLCRARVFQPESTDAPVQVLGGRETAGLAFDGLWILGLHEDALPRPVRPHPLLPLDLQRRHGVSRASAAGELAAARTLLERLRHAAPAGVVSHPAQIDGEAARPSPLVRDLPASAPAWPTGGRALLDAVHAAAAEERVPDTAPPPVAAPAAVRASGTLLRDQAQCAFRAFARHRLGVPFAPAPEDDLDARRWGILVHAALERLWGDLGDSARLAGAGAEPVEAAIRHALAQRDAPSGPERMVTAARLRRTLDRWLAVERERTTPFAVVGRELGITVPIAGLTVHGRIDRIDRLADGRFVVLDYKTGAVPARDWLGDRHADPQLLLYAHGPGEVLPQVAAVAFARVADDRMGFAGVGQAPPALEGVQPVAATDTPGGWPGVLDRWRAVLEDLGARFVAGDSEVEPLRDGSWPPAVCAHCPLPALCRIHERGTEGAG